MCLPASAAQRKRYIGRILCYHSVGQEEWGINDVTPAQFRRHIELALNAGYRFVPASEIARDRRQGRRISPSPSMTA